MNKRLELMNNHFKDDQQKKIAITTNQGTHFIDIDEIVLFEADGSYTSIYLKEGSKLVVSKKLKYFEDLLSANNAFFRTHRSHIIQFNHISIYNKGMGEIVMNNKRVASLSRERKNEFEERLNENGLN